MKKKYLFLSIGDRVRINDKTSKEHKNSWSDHIGLYGTVTYIVDRPAKDGNNAVIKFDGIEKESEYFSGYLERVLIAEQVLSLLEKLENKLLSNDKTRI